MCMLLIDVYMCMLLIDVYMCMLLIDVDMCMLLLGAFKAFLLLTLLTPELVKDKPGHIKNLKSSIEQKYI